MTRDITLGTAIVLATAFIAGCAPPREEPIPVEKSVFGEQVKQIKKAEDQVKQMDNRMQDLNKQLGESGG